MTDTSIAHQIKSISLLLIAGLVMLAALSVAATLVLRLVFIDYGTTAKSTIEANAVFEDLFEARIAALKWRFSHSADHSEEFFDNVDEIVEIAGLAQDAGLSPAFAEALGRVAGDMTTYRGYFEDRQRAYDAYVLLDEDIAAIGKTVREQLSAVIEAAFSERDPITGYHAARAQEALMLGRFYVERYRNTEDSAYLETARGHLGAARGALETLLPDLRTAGRDEMAQKALAGVSDYAGLLAKLEETVSARVQSRNAMDALGPRMVTTMEEAVDMVVTQQRALGRRGEAIVLATVLAIGLAALAIIAAGWIIARRNSRRIVGDIQASVAVMSRIADGDLEAEVANAEAENELGQMARALEVFKTNGKAAIDASRREKAAEEERQRIAADMKAQQERQEAEARAQAEAARQVMIDNLSASIGTVVAAASAGDFSQRVTADFSDEKLVALAQEINTLVQSVDRGLAVTGEALSRVAKGDLSEEMEGEFRGAFKALQDDTNGMIASLRSLIGTISASGFSLAASSGELRDTSASLSKQAEQNAAALEETSAALEELTASIKQVNDNVTDATDNARVARQTAQASAEVAAAAANAMARISDASREIAKVVSVIDDISFQINLLALNAGVEAARAGDAGRGFSVVASEVRQLAQRASEAAKEIDVVIAKSDTAVTEGVAKVSDAQSSLQKISESVIGVSQRIEEISNAITEQVSGVAEINTAISQIDQNTQKQAASFEEVTAASSLLSNEAESLKASTARFHTGIAHTARPAATARVAAPASPARAQPASAGNLALDHDGWDEF